MDVTAFGKVPATAPTLSTIAEDSIEHEPDRIEVVARRACAGDRGAVEELLALWYPSALSICQRVLRNADDAADATQDALVSVARGIRRWDGRSRFSTWAYRIATNAALDELRRRGRRVVRDIAPEIEDRPDDDPLEQRLIDRISIDEALGQLPDEQRAVLLLRHRLGLDYSEIASTVGVPVGTVRSRISRARAAMRDLLETPDPGRSTPTGNQVPAPSVEAEDLS